MKVPLTTLYKIKNKVPGIDRGDVSILIDLSLVVQAGDNWIVTPQGLDLIADVIQKVDDMGVHIVQDIKIGE